MAALAAAAAGAFGQAPPAPSIAGVRFERVVAPFEVRAADGHAHTLPFLGGLDVPRPQIVDIDGDGDGDAFVQEYSNDLAFFENTGTATAPRYEWRTDRFQDLDIGEWYRFVDLNGDGLVDLLSEFPTSHIRYYRNTGTKGRPRLTDQGQLKDGAGEPLFMDRQNIPTLADIDCDGRLDLLVGRVEGVVDHFEAVAPNAEQFAFVTDHFEGIEIIGRVGDAPRPTRHGANALALADFDADGDQDLYWGDFFEPAVLLIENVGRTCSTPSYQVDPIVLPWASETATSGYNAPAPVDIDGDGDMDFLMGVIGGAFNPIFTSEDNFYFWERTAPHAFELRTKRFLDGIDVGSDAVPALADIDADGDLDLLVGSKIAPTPGGKGQLTIYRNDGTRTAPRFQLAETLALGDAYNLSPALGDLDGDGDLDLLLGTWNQDVLYFRNDGSRTAPRWVQDESRTIKPPRVSHAMPVLADLDGDGDLDLLLGQANGALVFYRNTGSARTPAFDLVTDALDDIKVGRRSAPALVDVDGDGLLDLVIGRETAGAPAIYRNRGTRTAPSFALAGELDVRLPPASAPAFADIDGDGTLDLFAGTTSGGVRFFHGIAGR
ncbi:MAG: VCBS repeat-containing protein [Vicinamibacterales bacterium]